MTTVTTINAATPGNGITGPAQGAGGAAAGFEALLAAFFGEASAVAPMQGAGNAPALAPTAPATPLFLNGEAALDNTLVTADATATALTVLNPELVVGADAETALVAGILTPADGEEAPADEAQAVVDPTLLVDVAALVAPQPTAIVVIPETTTAQTQTAPAATVVAAVTPTTVLEAAPVQADASATAPVAAAVAPAADTTTEAPVAQVAAPAAEAATTTPATATAQAAPAMAQAAPAPAKPASEAPAPAQSPKTKASAPTQSAPARMSAPTHAETKVEAQPADVASMDVDAPVDADPAVNTPAQSAKAEPEADAPAMSEQHRAATTQARAPQQAATTTAAAATQAPVATNEPVEALAAAAPPVAQDAAATEAAPEQPAAPALTGAAQDVAAATAGRAAVSAARPTDKKEQAKAERSPLFDAKDAFAATVADVRKAGPAAMTAKADDKADAAVSKTAEADETTAAPAAAAQSEDTPVHVAEERPAEAARAAASHIPHPVRGSPETVANLAAQIIKKLNGKTTRFDIELTPHGMGTVDVRIEIQNGRVTAAMMFDNPQAAAELKARASELQRSLEQAGFDLSNGGLSFEAKDGGSAGRGWRQAQDQNDGRGMRGKAFKNAFDTANEAADIAESGALRLRRGASSGLDVRV